MVGILYIWAVAQPTNHAVEDAPSMQLHCPVVVDKVHLTTSVWVQTSQGPGMSLPAFKEQLQV